MCVMKFITIIIYSLVILHRTYSLDSGDKCLTPNGERAVCQSAFKCKPFLNLYPTPKADQTKFWRESQCGHGEDPLVCCGTLDNYWPSNRHFPKMNECASQATKAHMIINDTEMDGYQETDGYPWMVHVINKNQKNYYGIGVIISSRYILTLLTVHDLFHNKVGNVCFGRFNNGTYKNCIFENKPTMHSSVHKEIGTESVVISDIYRSYLMYIALIKLTEDLELKNNIQPICFSPRNERIKFGEKFYFIVWDNGIRTFELKATDNGKCEKGIEIYNYNEFVRVVCLENKNVHDLRGPRMGIIMKTSPTNITEWHFGGIVSFSPYDESSIRGLIIDVGEVLDWIFSNANN